ncbi:MAG: right-handed parallel beta-helix repeat-containing protein [Promethearchaeota archaeon]
MIKSEEAYSLKTSAYWNLTGTPIWIDETNITRDWAYTASNYDWCSGSGTWSDPYVIENVIIDGQNSSNCVLIQYSTAFFIIRNCTLYHSDLGSTPYHNNAAIKLHETDNGRILNNNLSNNYGSGITVQPHSYNHSISGNIIKGNSRYGINVFDHSDNNTISNNVIAQNSWRGIGITESSKNIIKENRVQDNFMGIEVIGICELNHLTMNKVSNNSDGGISIGGFSENNTAVENFILRHGTNFVFSWGPTNTWNNSRIGNYYDNYWGEDSDNDGIGDTFFNFVGGSVDWLPIVDDDAPNITINSPISNEIFNDTIPTFNVMIQDRYLDEMWYTLNEGTIKYYFTENGSIDQAAWESLPDGNVKIRFYGIDLPENEDFKEIIVRKGLPIATSIASYDIGIVVSSIFIISVVSIILVKKKQKSN